MQTLPIISLITNVALMITVLSLVLPKVKQHIREKKKRRENLSKLERANLVKTIRTEVRRYLEELKDE